VRQISLRLSGFATSDQIAAEPTSVGRKNSTRWMIKARTRGLTETEGNQLIEAAGPVSRILSAFRDPIAPKPGAPGTPGDGTIIPLGRALLRGSSDLPGTFPIRVPEG